MQTIGQVDIILALSLLLAAGFSAARLVRLLHLPSVTGYILAGIALGPSGFQVVPADALEAQLRVFTEIALMLVAFGIGERFDLGQLRRTGRVVARVS
jgi:Kef-type K+ transport system membrane component KefB